MYGATAILTRGNLANEHPRPARFAERRDPMTGTDHRQIRKVRMWNARAAKLGNTNTPHGFTIG
jgi:hypothetical protein